jgi:acyl dehydratase
LFTKPEYPFPAVGSVHVSNYTKIYRAMPVDEEYPALIKVDPVVRPAKKGTEVTFISTLHDKAGEPVWTNTSTFLVLHRRVQTLTPTVKPDREMQPPTETPPALEKKLKLAADMGRRYAAVAKDYNPIHTTPLAAKAFGFPGVIMHGMYFIVRAAGECQALMGDRMAYPVEVTAKFIRPVVLPHKATLKVTPTTAAGGNKTGAGGKGTVDHQMRYEVLNKAGKIAVEGTFHCQVQK